MENIINSCKSNIDFSDEVSNHINQCKKKLFKDCDLNNNFKQGIINSMEKEIQLKYKKAKEKYIKNNLNEDIFSYYVGIIEKVSESLVANSLQKLKSELIPRMQKEIENSPNFKDFYNKFNVNDNNLKIKSHLPNKNKLKPINKK